MEDVSTFLEEIQKHNYAKGHLLGLFNILIGRRVSRADKTVISSGATWRQVAQELTRLRWDPETIRDLGISAEELPPRDRQRYWFQAIAAAQVGSQRAIQDGDKLASILAKAGYVVGQAPGTSKT